MRLGAGAGGHDPHQPRLPVAVRLLQRELLHPQHGPPAGRDGDRRTELSWTASTASARWSSTTRCSSRTRTGCESGSRSTRARPTRCGPIGRRSRRHGAPMARSVRGAGARDELAHDLDRLRVGQRPHLQLLNKECTEEDNNFAIDLLNRIGDDMEATGQAAAQVLVPTSCWASPARRPRTPSRRCACSSA